MVRKMARQVFGTILTFPLPALTGNPILRNVQRYATPLDRETLSMPAAKNVIQFPRPKPRRYTIDILSETLDGKVLIEACIPVAALKALVDFLRAS